MAYTTINKSTEHFNTNLFTSNGSQTSQTGLGFRPDLVWNKSRSAINSHVICNSVSGTGKFLASNNTDAETTATGTVSSFDSDGFTLSADSGGYGNTNGRTYANWCWKANGTGSSNTDGSINTTYTSVNTTAGFSISQYTGTGSAATVGHGLGAVPRLIIIKKSNSSTGGDWYVYHASLGNNSKIWLNQTSAKGTGTHMNNTTPTSSVFSIGTPTEVNNSGDTYIAYCFAEKTGYSKFGYYTGNANADGTFVYTGFKPQFLMVKRYDASGDDWYIFDSVRDTDNTVDTFLYPNANSSEGTISPTLDFLSNGFKWRKASAFSPVNQSTATYIYMAFGQSIVGSNNVPCTAR